MQSDFEAFNKRIIAHVYKTSNSSECVDVVESCTVTKILQDSGLVVFDLEKQFQSDAMERVLRVSGKLKFDVDSLCIEIISNDLQVSVVELKNERQACVIKNEFHVEAADKQIIAAGKLKCEVGVFDEHGERLFEDIAMNEVCHISIFFTFAGYSTCIAPQIISVHFHRSILFIITWYVKHST